MARRPATKTPAPPRKRRSAEEARSAILDAAERLLVSQGPSAIRLQEIAANVGVSHPTVLHHFGSREGLMEALVVRALDSLHAGLLAAVQTAPKGPDKVTSLLDSVFATMVDGGHGRAFLWLALAGHVPTMEQLHVRSLAEAVHQVRRREWKGRRVPPFEDTYFTVLMPALALLAMSAMGAPQAKASAGAAENDELCSPARFRAWLARLIHQHLAQG